MNFSKVENMEVKEFEDWLDRQLSNALSYKDRLRNLADKLELLEAVKGDIKECEKELFEFFSEDIDSMESLMKG